MNMNRPDLTVATAPSRGPQATGQNLSGLEHETCSLGRTNEESA